MTRPSNIGITASQVRRLSERGGEGPSPKEAEFLATLSQAPQPSGRRHSVVTISKVPMAAFGRGRRESVAAYPSGSRWAHRRYIIYWKKNQRIFHYTDLQSIGITTRKSSINWTTHDRSIGQHSQFTVGHNGRYCASAQSTYETMEHQQRKSMRSADGRRSWWHKRNTNALHESTLLRLRWFGANTDPSQ